MNDELRIAVHQGRAGLAELQADWDRLASGLPEKRFVHCFHWYRSYLDALETDPQSVHFVALYRADLPVAIFPLKRSARTMAGITMRILEIPRHSHSDLRDFIYARSPENTGLISQLLSHLRQQRDIRWDWLSMTNVPEDSAAAFSLASSPPARLVTVQHGTSKSVPCCTPQGTALDRLSGNFRRNLRRLARRCEEQGTLTYHSYREPQDLQRAFEQFLDVEASSWKGKTGTGSAIRLDPSTVRFYQELMTSFSATRDCFINLLMLNDKCIAGQFCLLSNGVLNVLKIGYLEEYENVAPGNLLFERLFRDCSPDGPFHTVNFVTGAAWNDVWKPVSLRVMNYHLFNCTWRGILGFTALGARNLLRAIGRKLPSKRPAKNARSEEA